MITLIVYVFDCVDSLHLLLSLWPTLMINLTSELLFAHYFSCSEWDWIYPPLSSSAISHRSPQPLSEIRNHVPYTRSFFFHLRGNGTGSLFKMTAEKCWWNEQSRRPVISLIVPRQLENEMGPHISRDFIFIDPRFLPVCVYLFLLISFFFLSFIIIGSRPGERIGLGCRGGIVTLGPKLLKGPGVYVYVHVWEVISVFDQGARQ